VAEHRLIAAYRDDLLTRLPSQLAGEVSDGLADAQEKYLAQGLTPDQAARAAIAEFGSPGIVADAFRRASPAWSAARALILTGPVIGGLWAATLITGHAWQWPIPAAGRLAAALTLGASVVMLATATRTRRYQAARHACLAGSLGLVSLDASVTVTALLVAPGIPWLLWAAACASAVRLTYAIPKMQQLASWPGT
jgi:hypothetical protein